MRATAALPLESRCPPASRSSARVTPVEQKDAGRWTRGDVARVRLEIDAQSDMSWVVVDDPVPGGATISAAASAASRSCSRSGEQREGWAWPAFEERRFDAFRAYYRFVPKGHLVVEYTVRLNNPGTFVLPATRVEAMYAPEMFGELPNAAVVVEPKRREVGDASHRRGDARRGRVHRARRLACRCWRRAGARRRRSPTCAPRWTPSDAYLLDRNGEVLDHACASTSNVRRRVDAARRGVAGAHRGDRRRRGPPLLASTAASTGAACSARCATGALRGARRGASTITMQVAALLRRRTRAREAVAARGAASCEQMRMARALEGAGRKQQILEAYLNLLGFRGELQGIGAASHVLAGKAPSGLDAAGKPGARGAAAAAQRAPPTRVAARAVHARASLRRTARSIAPSSIARGRDGCCSTRRAAFGRATAARAAPRACACSATAGERVQTTLDAQRAARSRATRSSQQLDELAARNVATARCSSSTTTTGDVLAYVGSAGPTRARSEVDGVRARARPARR